MNFFRIISGVEGLSFLTLLFVAMPLRAFFGMPEVVYYVGWVHGALFLAYFALATVVSHRWQWSVGYWLLVLALGAVPFGFLYVESRLKRALRAREAAA